MHSEQWLPARGEGNQNEAVALGGCPARCRKRVRPARLLRRANPERPSGHIMHSEQWLPARSGGNQNGAVALGGCPARCRKQVEHARLLQRADHVVGLDKVPSRLSSILRWLVDLTRCHQDFHLLLRWSVDLTSWGLTGSQGTPFFRLACEQ